MSLSALRLVFRPDYVEAGYSCLRDAVRADLRAWGEDRIILLYILWDLTGRQRRFTLASPAIDRYLFEQVTPLLDNDIVDLGFQLPLTRLIGRRLYKRMIVRTFPELSDVPWSRTGKPLTGNFARGALQVARMAAGKRLRRLLRGSSPPQAHASPLRQLRDPGLRRIVERFLESDAFPGDVLDRDGVRDVLRRHFDTDGGQHVAMVRLLTLAETSRLFIEQNVDEPPEEVQPQLGEL